MEEERPTKQVIVMRKDLGMRKGKMVAQGAHASLKALLDSGLLVPQGVGGGHGRAPVAPEAVQLWLNGSFTKVCVSVNSEEALIAVYETAVLTFLKYDNFPQALIIDAGRTEFKGVPTKTCCAIGPWWADEIDEITGKLPLL